MRLPGYVPGRRIKPPLAAQCSQGRLFSLAAGPPCAPAPGLRPCREGKNEGRRNRLLAMPPACFLLLVVVSGLSAQAKCLDDCAVTVYVAVVEIVEQSAALAHELGQ